MGATLNKLLDCTDVAIDTAYNCFMDFLCQVVPENTAARKESQKLSMNEIMFRIWLFG